LLSNRKSHTDKIGDKQNLLTGLQVSHMILEFISHEHLINLLRHLIKKIHSLITTDVTNYLSDCGLKIELNSNDTNLLSNNQLTTSFYNDKEIVSRIHSSSTFISKKDESKHNVKYYKDNERFSLSSDNNKANFSSPKNIFKKNNSNNSDNMFYIESGDEELYDEISMPT
jgi:hypothetical protein